MNSLEKARVCVILGDISPNKTIMKTTLLAASLIVGLAASSALASDKDSKDAKETKASTEAATKSAAKEKIKTDQTVVLRKQEVLLTGSNIKREVRSDGQVTDAPNSLTVIDRKAIERSGVADLRQVLARQSGIR